MPDGSAHRHVSPVQPDTNNVADLEQQLKASQEMQQQLQYELNSLHENQFDAIESAKKEVAANYESQFTDLQQTLLQTEHRCIALETDLSEMRASHSAEIENLLGRQEEIRATMLQERDQKHATHVMRLTAELTSQPEISGVVVGDSDEQEAERLRMIKEKMREMHDDEKRQIAAKHEQEKAKIQEEYQQQMDLYRQQMEQLANTKIQEMHAQFMSAHQIVLDQKNMAETAVAQWRGRVEEIQQQLDAVNEERSNVDVKYKSMVHTHSTEMELSNQKSQDLQNHLVEWKEKAASLEARLEKLESQRADDVDHIQQQNQEAVQSIIADYEEKLKAQHSLIEEYRTRVQSLEATHDVAINEIEQQHVQDMDELKTKHSSEVSLLEESISDSSVDRASLEVAEEHMKSVQVQLDAYRTQESSFQGRLENLEQQHIVDTELLKQQLEAQKVEEVEQVSAKFAAQIESLEEELTTLQSLVEAGQSQTTGKEVIEAMKAKHQREILELQTTLQNSHELALKDLRKELQFAHSTTVESLQQQHANMVSTLRRELDTEWADKVRKAKEQVASEFDHARRAELQQVTSEHKQALERLQQSQAQTEEGGIAKAEARVIGLETEVQKLRDEQSEWLRLRQDLLSQLEFSQRQLQESSQRFGHMSSKKLQLEEQCQKYQNEMKSLETDLNVAHGSSKQDKQALAEAQEEIEQFRAKADELQGEIGKLEEAQRVSAAQSNTVLELTGQLAQKNVVIADLEAQNDSLNTEVFSLTQKCHQHIASAEMLQKQLESTGSANEQVASLQQQLGDLLPVKEGYRRMQEKAESLESQLQGRERELGMLQSQLEQTAQQVAETGAQWSSKYEELTASSTHETEALRQEIASHRAREVELKQQLSQHRQQINMLEPKEQENAQAIVGLNQTVQDLRGRLDSAGNEIKQLRQEKRKLEQDLKDSQGILDELAGDDHETELSKNYERLQQDFETVRAEKTQLALELAELQKEQRQVLQEQKKSWEGKLQEQEKVIHDLQAQLSARESAFTEIQNEFGRQLTEAETRESSLLQRLQDSTMTQEQLGTVLGEKSALEEILSRARQNLKEKLQEKEALEKELNFHRTELERRLGEKHRLEELLFEKSRFEQEIQSQRDQLQEELKEIESKLKLKDVDLERERSEWLEQVQEKDMLLQVKEAEVQLKGDEYRQKEEQLQQQHSTELSQLSEGLNHQHNMHISALTEDHRQQLTDVETGLRYKHSEALHTFEAKHKKEVI